MVCVELGAWSLDHGPVGRNSEQHMWECRLQQYVVSSGMSLPQELPAAPVYRGIVTIITFLACKNSAAALLDVANEAVVFSERKSAPNIFRTSSSTLSPA